MMAIRDYRESDRESWKRTYSLLLTHSHAWTVIHQERPSYEGESILLVADIDGTIAGLLDCEIVQGDVPAGVIKEFGVHPDHQQRGIGRRLIETMVSRLKEKGVRRLEVTTMDPNAMKFYQACGLVEYKRSMRVFLLPDGELKKRVDETPFEPFYMFGSCEVERFDELSRDYQVMSEKPFEPHEAVSYRMEL